MASCSALTPQAARRRLWIGLLCLGMGLFMAVSQAEGDVEADARMAANMSQWTHADAAAYRGPLTGVLRVDGRLDSPSPIFMPDNAQRVIRGWLMVKLIAIDKTTGKRWVEPLFAWDQSAEKVSLAGEGGTLPLAVDAAHLPLRYAEDPTAELILQDGAPVEVRYHKLSWPLDPRKWQNADLSVEVERAWLPAQLPVAVVAGLDGSSGEARLVPMTRMPIKVIEQSQLGNPNANRGQDALLLMVGILLAIAGAKLVNGGLLPARGVSRVG